MGELQEQGVVTEVRGGVAVVRVAKSGACAGCGAAGACRGGGAAERLVEAENAAAARPGDPVVIVVSTKAVLLASLLVYALPVLSLLAGAGGAQLAAGALAPGATEQAAGIGGILGAVAGALGARRLARHRAPPTPIVRVVRILP